MTISIQQAFLRGIMVLLSVWTAGATILASETQPVVSPVATLSAPREVLFGEDATFQVAAKPEVSGSVRFELKTLAGEVVWTNTATLTEGRASAVLLAADGEKLEKGSFALVATLDSAPANPLYAAVRLRGRIFENLSEMPAHLQPGDEIIITDVTKLQPSEAISDSSTKGKWWRRRFQIPGQAEEQSLVCVEEHDLDDPQSCIAGQLTLPLTLKGWFEVWVRTYRHQEHGGVDVRLSGEKYFLHVDPLQVDTQPGQPQPHGTLVDVLFRAVDLSDQSLVFQQPFGTYASENKRCNASLAGVRLVKLSDQQVSKLQSDRARKDVKRIGYDDDGFSYFFDLGVHDEAAIARLIEPLRNQSAEWLNVSLGGLGAIIIPTPYTGMYQMKGDFDRDGDRRANAFFRWCFENNVNIVDVLARRAHEVDLKLFVSLMTERSFSDDKTMREHPEWKIKRKDHGWGQWDYALPEVQDYQIKKLAWICEHHEIDGFIVDFTRYGHHFNTDEPKKFECMNTFVRNLRAAIDAVNAKKDRKVQLCASFGDRSWHLTHWGSGTLEDQGLDVKTWLQEGIFDILMPEGANVLDYVDMAKSVKSRTQVWPRKVGTVSFEQHVQREKPLEGPKEMERGAKYWFDHAAPGIFFFNHVRQSTLGRLGFAEERPLRAKLDDEIYGMREGPAIQFASWYPEIEQEKQQRGTFKPLTVEASGRAVDAVLKVPFHNTFEHPIAATITWVFPKEDQANRLSIVPAFGSVTVDSGKDGEVVFRVKGEAMPYAAMPRAMIELSRADQVVLRHSLPLRAVPQIICKRTDSAPNLDGVLDDPAWGSVGGLKPIALFPMGKAGRTPANVKTALAYDQENLYLAMDVTGDVSRVDRTTQPRNAREIYEIDHVQVLLDSAAVEKEYRKFVATPAGGQAEDASHFDPFHGRFVRQTNLTDSAWTARAVLRSDGYSVEMAIPLKALNAKPKPGDVWRMNIVTTSKTAAGTIVVDSWSSPETFHTLPRHFGTLFGTLRFE